MQIKSRDHLQHFLVAKKIARKTSSFYFWAVMNSVTQLAGEMDELSGASFGMRRQSAHYALGCNDLRRAAVK